MERAPKQPFAQDLLKRGPPKPTPAHPYWRFLTQPPRVCTPEFHAFRVSVFTDEGWRKLVSLLDEHVTRPEAVEDWYEAIVDAIGNFTGFDQDTRPDPHNILTFLSQAYTAAFEPPEEEAIAREVKEQLISELRNLHATLRRMGVRPERLVAEVPEIKEIVEARTAQALKKQQELIRQLEEKVAQLIREREKAPPPPGPTAPPEAVFMPPPRELTEAEKKDLEELFKREMALRGLPLKTPTINYLDLFRAYLERWKMVPAKRIRENRIPNLIAAIEEALTQRTRVTQEELTRRIRQSEAKFRVGDYVNYEGKNYRVLEVVEIDQTGRYSYRLEGVEGLIDEGLLRKVEVPPPEFSVGDPVILDGNTRKGYIVVDRKFDFEANEWKYDLEEIT
jgi:hypothetical protein